MKISLCIINRSLNNFIIYIYYNISWSTSCFLSFRFCNISWRLYDNLILYLSFMFCFNMSIQCRIAQITFTTWTAKLTSIVFITTFSLSDFFRLLIMLLTHITYNINKSIYLLNYIKMASIELKVIIFKITSIFYIKT